MVASRRWLRQKPNGQVSEIRRLWTGLARVGVIRPRQAQAASARAGVVSWKPKCSTAAAMRSKRENRRSSLEGGLKLGGCMGLLDCLIEFELLHVLVSGDEQVFRDSVLGEQVGAEDEGVDVGGEEAAQGILR